MDYPHKKIVFVVIVAIVIAVILAIFLLSSSRTQKSSPQDDFQNVPQPNPSLEKTLDSLTAPASSKKEEVILEKEIINSLTAPEWKKAKEAQPKTPQEVQNVIDSLSAPKN